MHCPRLSIILLICASLVAAPLPALEESTVEDRIKAAVLTPQPCPATEPDRDATPGAPFWRRQIVTNPADGYRVRVSRFGCGSGASGTVLIAPGRTESSVEYLETALDFIARGFGPVYAIDHRGQGFSPRLLADTHKGHVARFEDYVDDFAAVVDHVRAETGSDRPLHVTSNSMGGAIVIGYLQANGAAAAIDSAALMGPMIRVNYFSFVDKPATRFNLALYSETGALWQARLRCLVPGGCDSFAANPDTARYDPATRVFRPDDEALMTHSRARYDLRTWLWDKIDRASPTAGPYGADETWDGLHLGGATFRWVREAARFNRQMRQPDRLALMGHVPVLILTGTRDLRAYRQHPDSTGIAPDLAPHEQFCARLNAATETAGAAPICRFIPIEGAFHELYKEADRFRDPVLNRVAAFFAAAARGADDG